MSPNQLFILAKVASNRPGRSRDQSEDRKLFLHELLNETVFLPAHFSMRLFKQKCTISIALERIEYTAGDTVKGFVQLVVHESFTCKSIIVQATGKEKTHWTVRHNRRFDDEDYQRPKKQFYGGKSTFFKFAVPIHNIQGAILVHGNYCYPFQFVLPADLPNSATFAASDRGLGSITYKLTIQSIAMEVQHEVMAETKGSVRFLCCFNKGTCHIRGKIKRSAYWSGEIVNVIGHIENDSERMVSSVQCTLYQSIILRDNQNRSRRSFKNINRQVFRGLKPHEAVDKVFLLHLSGAATLLHPTHESELITCRYFIELSCDIPWCPSIRIRLSVIISPQRQYRKGTVEHHVKEAIWIGKKGCIGTILDRPVYAPGEIVTGRVQLEVFQPIQCNRIVVKATETEKTHWTERKGSGNNSRTVHYRGKSTFFKVTIPLHSVSSGTILPGTYMYPFQYQLAPNLPSSCRFDAGVNGTGSIEYKLKGTVDINGIFARDLKSKIYIGVRSNVCYMQQAAISETTRPVKFLCCFSKGSCHLFGQMERISYFPGEMANIITRVNNDSTVDVSGIRCTLRQYITLRNNFGRVKRTSNKCHRQKFDGVSPTQAVEKLLEMQLNGPYMYPTHASQLIECRYELELCCDIRMCPDVQVRLPIVIAAPEMACAATIAPTGPPLAVPVHETYHEQTSSKV